MNKETIIQNKTRVTLGSKLPGVRTFRNQVGKYKVRDARTGRDRWITSGLAPGSSDLIGIAAIEVTPEMVGTYVGVFVSIEIKQPGEKPNTEQAKWLSMVRRFGGVSLIATSPEHALDQLKELRLVDIKMHA